MTYKKNPFCPLFYSFSYFFKRVIFQISLTRFDGTKFMFSRNRHQSNRKVYNTFSPAQTFMVGILTSGRLFLPIFLAEGSPKQWNQDQNDAGHEKNCTITTAIRTTTRWMRALTRQPSALRTTPCPIIYLSFNLGNQLHPSGMSITCLRSEKTIDASPVSKVHVSHFIAHIYSFFCHEK